MDVIDQVKFSNQYRLTAVNTIKGGSTKKESFAPPYLLSFIAEPFMASGYIKGYRQPVAVLQIKVAPFTASQITHLQQALQYYFPNYPMTLNDTPTAEECVICFGQLLAAIQYKAEHPIFETIRVESIGEQCFYVWIPMLNAICLQQTLGFVVNFVNRHAVSAAFTTNEACTKQKNELLTFLQACAPGGSNSYRFLEAAHKANIPWIFVGTNAFQFGYGCYSKWFDSSATGNTAYIPVKFSKDKWHASAFLQRLGFPVPEKYVVSNEKEAITIANKIGYPVVLKPDNQDGGEGVTANINTEQRLIKAYHSARKYSSHVLLEKHIIGKDYRLIVLNGQLIWAIERIPAGVFGDGVSTVETLVNRTNQSPSRTREFFPVKKLAFDEEANDLLVEHGLQLHSIPEKGRFVALSRIANISRGGTAVGVFDKVHPDNKQLVETIAKLFRLDLAGIDFIIPNIQVSYRETGGKILEINSQPQLCKTTAPHIYHQILTTLIPNQGRIPIIVIVGHYANEIFIQLVKTYLFNQYQGIGIAINKKAFINDQLIIEAGSLNEAGKTLLALEEVQALIYCLNDLGDLDQGLPFDRYDQLFILGEPLASVKTQQRESDLMDALFKAHTGQSFMMESVIPYLTKFTNPSYCNTVVVYHKAPTGVDTVPDFVQQLAFCDDKRFMVQAKDGQVTQLDEQVLENTENLSPINKLLIYCALSFCERVQDII